jgi:uncharacterized protein Yka (UPF0111/DUF47 family)
MVDMTRRRWLLPDSPDVLAMLRDQTAVTVDGMRALVTWSGGDRTAADTVRACEHLADQKKRTLWRTLRDAFSTPLDAEDLYALSADLDQVLNASKDLVREADVMNLDPDPPTHEMVVLLAEAVGYLSDALSLLGTHEGDATASADAAIRSQRTIEHVYRRAMSSLLAVDDLHEVNARREIYRRVSRIGDLIHTAADRVWYAVVKEA